MTWRIFRLQKLSGEQLNTLDQHILAVPAQGAGGHPSEVCEDRVLDGILHVGPLDKYSKISSRTQVSNHKYFQSVIYLLHYLCLLCFESQHCTEDDVGELMLAGKEKATLVQLRNSTEINISQLRITTSPLFHFSIDIWIWNYRETCCLPCVTSRLVLSASNRRLMVFHAAQPLYNLGRGLHSILHAQSGSTSRPAGETVISSTWRVLPLVKNRQMLKVDTFRHQKIF